MQIRNAGPGDIHIILDLIRDLAIYEQEEDQAKATTTQIEAALFSPQPTAYCDLIEVDVSGVPAVVGFALWFKNYSTWTGTPGIYLEDLFVQPSYRGKGYGKALLVNLAQRCVANGWQRLQWWVLDWNEPAIEFYTSLGAVPMDEWTVFRVSGNALEQLANGARGSQGSIG